MGLRTQLITARPSSHASFLSTRTLVPSLNASPTVTAPMDALDTPTTVELKSGCIGGFRAVSPDVVKHAGDIVRHHVMSLPFKEKRKRTWWGEGIFDSGAKATCGTILVPTISS